MQTDFIKILPRHFTWLCLLLLVAACQSQPKTADEHAVIDAALAHDDAMMINDMDKLDAIENKLAQQQAISESEAIIYALKHNPSFNAQLIDLKLAQADLVTAGLIPNPELLYSFGVSNKPYRYAIDFPLEALWQRPIKIRKMKYLADGTALRLTQSGLDLIKAVRVAYAQVVLAAETLNTMQSAANLATEIVTLSKKRLALGDISLAELITLQQAATQSKLALEQAEFDFSIKKTALRYQLGVPKTSSKIKLSASLSPACEVTSAEHLHRISVAQRPEVLAAEQAVLAAQAQVKLSKVSWFRLIGSADATSGNKTGHEFSPTFRATVPIANKNQGAVSRSEAELEKATLNLTVAKQKARLATQQAAVQYQQACNAWQTHQAQVLPAASQNNALVKLAYQDGEISYLDTLQSQQALILAQMTELRLRNNVMNQWAEIKRNVSNNTNAASTLGAQKNDK